MGINNANTRSQDNDSLSYKIWAITYANGYRGWSLRAIVESNNSVL